jgi:hypothetical protein
LAKTATNENARATLADIERAEAVSRAKHRQRLDVRKS